MLTINRLLGNVHSDASLRDSCSRMDKLRKLEILSIEPAETGKRRLRKITDQGTDVGVALENGTTLRDGDVLYLVESDKAIIVEVKPAEVLAILLDTSLPPTDLLACAVELGRVLGNQHWSVHVEGATVYVPVTIDSQIMETILITHHLNNLPHEFKRVKLDNATLWRQDPNVPKPRVVQESPLVESP